MFNVLDPKINILSYSNKDLAQLLPSTLAGNNRAVDALFLALGNGDSSLDVSEDTIKKVTRKLHECIVYVNAAADTHREYLRQGRLVEEQPDETDDEAGSDEPEHAAVVQEQQRAQVQEQPARVQGNELPQDEPTVDTTTG